MRCNVKLFVAVSKRPWDIILNQWNIILITVVVSTEAEISNPKVSYPGINLPITTQHPADEILLRNC